MRLYLWRAHHDLPDELYAGDLFDEALAHARQLWDDLRGGAVAPADIRRRFELRRPAGVISVAVDRVEAGDASERWVRVKSGRVKDADMRDTRIILYGEAYAAMHGAEPNVAIHYTRTGEIKQARPSRDTRERHLEKIDAHLAGIAAGRWDPHRGHHCAECPFVLICPV